MAKTKTRSHTFGGGQQFGRAPAPMVLRIASPSPVKAPKGKKTPHRRRGSSSGGGITSGGLTTIVIGAGIVGLAEKSSMWASIPSLPMLGKKGTVALACWYWGKHGGGPYVKAVGFVAAALTAYQYARDGKVDGDDEM